MPAELFDPPLLPFTLALCGVLAIALLEALSAILGHSLSGLVDDAVPDISASHPEMDAHLEVEGGHGAFEGSHFDAALSWLSFGRVPLLVLVILFLLGFGGTGFVLQVAAANLFSAALPPGLAAIPAVAGGGLFMRFLGRAIGRVIPKEETAAISRESFVGRMGIVSAGTARTGLPAQIRITDEHGTTHYLLAEPDDEGDAIETGTPVIVISLAGAKARVMRDPTA
ncbi:OB-fold-containig protein [Aurantimonas sp. VKM B-3413]|uniref:OB-fold-containig protein n=1 Tax=Aurantimonas sp. VKM B-3413 TaxID=2779401 RepID=UPI001E4A71BD|nr:YqiJ family protein [Aurantimonas sp. VKM B-3413]